MPTFFVFPLFRCLYDASLVPAQRCSEVESDLFDLFALLGATDEQLDFPVLYASAKEGWVTARLPSAAHPLQPQERCMDALLDKILEHVPPPAGDPEGPFKMLVRTGEHGHRDS
jgi:GTP-binding protein